MTDANSQVTTPPLNFAVPSPLVLSEMELAALRKNAEADMQKHGFKTVKELIDFYDSKRGY